jgi:hypothetical protein
MRLLGPGLIRDGGGSSKPTAKAAPKPATKTKAQIEKEERDRLAAATAAKEAQIKRDQAASLAAFKASGLGAAGFISMTDSRAMANNAGGSTVVSGGSGGGGGNTATIAPKHSAPESASPAADPPAATPHAPQQDSIPTPVPAVKSAPIDTIEFVDDVFSEELIIDLLFEDIGGQEILSIARNDTVNGQSVVYQPIKNLGILQQTYNPAKLLRIQETSDKFFSNFTIDLRSKIPNVGSGPNGKNYKIDSVTGELILEFVNLRSDEQVEIQIASDGIIEEIGI